MERNETSSIWMDMEAAGGGRGKVLAVSPAARDDWRCRTEDRKMVTTSSAV